MAEYNTKYRITGEDATAAAWASVQRNAANSIGQIQRMVPGLAAALGAAGLVTFAKQGIDAADKLNDLSKSTSISVEKLAGLQLLARQTGTDLDGLAKGINKMSVEMGKDPEKFRALGITAKDNTEAFKQFADIFNKLPDINQRNALAQSVFGRSWQELAPALSEGGKQIGEIIERGTQLSGITQEIAEQADKFNDKWAELTTTGAIFNRVLAPALPLLNELADSMLRAGERSNGLSSSFSPLAESLKAVMILGANVSFVFETIGMDVARAIENVKLLAQGDFAGSRQLGEIFKKDAQDRRKALDEYEKKILAIGLTGETKPVQQPLEPGDSSAPSKAAAFLGTGKEGETARKAEQKKRLAEEIAGGEAMRALWEKNQAERLADEVQAGADLRALVEADRQAKLDADIEMGADMKAMFQQDQADKLAAYTAMSERIWESGMTDQELLRANYEAEFNLLNQSLSRKYFAEAQYNALMQRLVTKYEKDRTKLEDAEIRKRFGISNVYRKADMDSAGFFADQMGALMQTKSRTLFEIGKAGAIAGAVIDSYKAATGAYAALAGIPIVGPALGAAAAAAAVAVGMARVSAIKSTSFGSGGGAVGTFAANPSTGLPEDPTSSGFDSAPISPLAQRQVGTSKTITVNFIGGGRYTQQEIRESLIPALNEAAGDGVTIRVN